jgi:hypothetical protein
MISRELRALEELDRRLRLHAAFFPKDWLIVTTLRGVTTIEVRAPVRPAASSKRGQKGS